MIVIACENRVILHRRPRRAHVKRHHILTAVRSVYGFGVVVYDVAGPSDTMGDISMKATQTGIVVPVLMLVVGVGWLLSNLGVFPGVNFAWPLGLAATGALTLVLRGINKGSIVIGPFLIVAAGFSILRQLDKLSLDIEVPCLVIALGALLVISHVSNLPSGLERDNKD
jgi:hypothetical protein